MKQLLRWNKTPTFLRASGEGILIRGTSYGLRIAAGILLARLLGVDGFGTYSFAAAWLSFLMIPSSLGVEHITLRFVSIYKERSQPGLVRAVLSVGLRTAVTSSIIFAAVASATIFLLNLSAELGLTLLLTLACLPLVVASQVLQSALQGLNWASLAQIPENLLYPGLLIALILLVNAAVDDKLEPWYVAGMAFVSWIGTVALTILFLGSRLPRGGIDSHSKEEKEWRGMIPVLVLSGSASFITYRGDVLILGMLGTTTQVGLYSAANRWAEQLLFPFHAIIFAGAPIFASIYASGNVDRLRHFAEVAGKTILFISLPLYVVLIVSSGWLLAFLGEGFQDGVPIMRVLLTANLLSCLCGFVTQMLVATGHHKDVAKVMLMAAAVNVLFCLIFTRLFGPLGTAIAAGTTTVSYNVILAWVVYRRLGVTSVPLWLLRKRVES